MIEELPRARCDIFAAPQHQSVRVIVEADADADAGEVVFAPE